MALSPVQSNKTANISGANAPISHSTHTHVRLDSIQRAGEPSIVRTLWDSTASFFYKVFSLIVWIFSGCPKEVGSVIALPQEVSSAAALPLLQKPIPGIRTNKMSLLDPATQAILKMLFNPATNLVVSTVNTLNSINKEFLKPKQETVSTLAHIFSPFVFEKDCPKSFPLYLKLLKDETELLKKAASTMCKEVNTVLSKGSKNEAEMSKNLQNFFEYLAGIFEHASKEEFSSFITFAYENKTQDDLKSQLKAMGNQHCEHENKAEFSKLVDTLFENEAHALNCLFHPELAPKNFGLQKPIDLKILFGKQLLSSAPPETIKKTADLFAQDIPLITTVLYTLANCDVQAREQVACRLDTSMGELATVLQLYQSSKA